MMHRPLATSAAVLSALAALVTLGLAACSSSTSSPATTPDTTNPEDGGSSGTDGGGSTGTDTGVPTDPSVIPAPTACPSTKFATVVVVGDSISDVGGGTNAEKPFYRTLLLKNDDAKYAAWTGFDLTTCWGLADANVVKVSKGGAVAKVSGGNPNDMGILLNQTKAIPADLPGPVLVVGTIGGNDAQAGLYNVVVGTPAQQQTDIDNFVSGFGQAMAELTKADRFGAGVKARVLMTNIYDPSAGTGNFYYEPGKAKCPGALGLWPAGTTTAEPLQKWNAAMATEAAKYPEVTLLTMDKPFAAHAVSTPDPTNWFAKDCIHPNPAGHDAVRGIFWAGMRALSAP